LLQHGLHGTLLWVQTCSIAAARTMRPAIVGTIAMSATTAILMGQNRPDVSRDNPVGRLCATPPINAADVPPIHLRRRLRGP
jgi:hypothetical protein